MKDGVSSRTAHAARERQMLQRRVQSDASACVRLWLCGARRQQLLVRWGVVVDSDE